MVLWSLPCPRKVYTVRICVFMKSENLSLQKGFRRDSVFFSSKFSYWPFKESAWIKFHLQTFLFTLSIIDVYRLKFLLQIYFWPFNWTLLLSFECKKSLTPAHLMPPVYSKMSLRIFQKNMSLVLLDSAFPQQSQDSYKSFVELILMLAFLKIIHLHQSLDPCAFTTLFLPYTANVLLSFSWWLQVVYLFRDLQISSLCEEVRYSIEEWFWRSPWEQGTL